MADRFAVVRSPGGDPSAAEYTFASVGRILDDGFALFLSSLIEGSMQMWLFTYQRGSLLGFQLGTV